MQEIVTFHCNLANTQIRGMRFDSHFYKTSDPSEIAFLRNYGAQQGCIVTEYGAERDNNTPDETGNSALNSILDAIYACETKEALDEYCTSLDESLPPDNLSDDDAKVIAKAIKSRKTAFKIESYKKELDALKNKRDKESNDRRKELKDLIIALKKEL